jgi:hypothetical protein
MHDQNQQATAQQSTVEVKPAVSGQADPSVASYHNDGTKTFDPRTRAELEAAGDANRSTQSAHALPKIEQCKPVEGQCNPDGHCNGNPSESSDEARRRHHAQPLNCTQG